MIHCQTRKQKKCEPHPTALEKRRILHPAVEYTMRLFHADKATQHRRSFADCIFGMYIRAGFE